MKRSKRKAPLCLPPIQLDGDQVKNLIAAARPKNSKGSYAFKWDYLEQEILSKYVSKDTDDPLVRAERAIDKMLLSEERCKKINNEGFGSKSKLLSSVLFEAKTIVSSILGDLPRDLFQTSKFTGGASTSRKRTHGHPYFKYDTRRSLDVTGPLRSYAEALITCTPLWCSNGGYFALNTVPGNQVTTVPKKSDIDRAIAKEPDLNMCMQGAVGRHIRGRLKTICNINLNDQTRNQELAKFGARTGLVATIDLSSASDSISSRLVWEILPDEWFDLLNRLRSPYGTLPNGEVIRWEMFSSMGNGFTFELESMIFYAFTVATYNALQANSSYKLPNFEIYWSQHTSVYGDDIICPSFMAGELITILSDIGFETNKDKTFVTGPFRESCGKHYHNVTDVTPFYVRKPIDHSTRLIWLLNKIRKWAFDEALGMCDDALHPLWLTLRRRYGLEDFLGGRDIDDDSCIYSSEYPRKRLINKTLKRRVGGYRAFLSLAQDWGRSLDDFILEQRFSNRSQFINANGQNGVTLCTIVEHEYLQRQNIVEDSRLLWSPLVYRFSKEIR